MKNMSWKHFCNHKKGRKSLTVYAFVSTYFEFAKVSMVYEFGTLTTATNE